jgi:hypothetical protein
MLRRGAFVVGSSIASIFAPRDRQRGPFFDELTIRAEGVIGATPMRRSGHLLLLLPPVAALAALARWLLQARGNVYTDMSTRFYLPDADLGWRVVEDGPVSLGLDAVGALSAYAVALVIALLVVGRWERRRGARLPFPQAARWVVATLPLLVPTWAFASGAIPASASDRAPSGLVEAPADSIRGGLPGLQSGTYRVIPHAGTSITARVSGGGEAFDARFARDIEGTWRADPADLRQPMSADISVGTAVVDTGIEARSRHAREEYLQDARFPRIRFRLERLLAAGPPAGHSSPADSAIAYRAEGSVDLIGQHQRVAVTGIVRALDPASRSRLGLPASEPILRATARFELEISETALAEDAGDFDKDIIPVEVSLLLRREAEPHR